jgi:glutathione peroxidase
MNQIFNSIYDFSAPRLDGRPLPLSDFRGQVLLIVNTASQCGFTPQYAGMEHLYRTFGPRGFTVLGFPSNQFGGQEPGSEIQIGEFCEKNFGVSFPMFAKIEVNGPGSHPIYQFLKKQRPGMLGWLTGGRIGWNFTKFLVGRSGNVVARHGSTTRPLTLAHAIEELLRQKGATEGI